MNRQLVARVVIERWLTDEEGDDGDVVVTHCEGPDGEVDGLPIIEVLGMLELGRLVYLGQGADWIRGDD